MRIQTASVLCRSVGEKIDMRRENKKQPAVLVQDFETFVTYESIHNDGSGILAIDTAGRVIECDQRFHDLWGLTTAISVGTSLTTLRVIFRRKLMNPEVSPPFMAAEMDTGVGAPYVFSLNSGRVIEGRQVSTLSGRAKSVRRWSFRDVTEETRTARRDALLARIARMLVSFDLEAVFTAVAQASVPVLGEACAVDWFDDGASRRLIEVKTTTASSIEVSTGAEERASLSVPIRVEGRPVAVLTYVAQPERRYGWWEQELAAEVADHLALTVAQCDVHRKTAEVATRRENFLYLVAHELRNPLGTLRMNVDSLRYSGMDDPHAPALVDAIAEDERRVTGIVADLLDAGRIRSGQLDLELGPVDLAAVTREVVDSLAAEVARAGSCVTVKAEHPIVGMWDRRRLIQVATNLLSNALKFGRGRPVKLLVEEGARGVRLVVVDHGVGITPDLQPQIFEPFHRGRNARGTGGLGLGLHIVRSIVRSMGGDVSVDSTPEQGATFTVELPRFRS
jgi:signal transduction histidine kinase